MPCDLVTARQRALIDDDEARIGALCDTLDTDRLPRAVEVGEVADTIRGFGHVKEASMQRARARWARQETQPVQAGG